MSDTTPRDQLIELLYSQTHAPMSTHSQADGSCTECPWPTHHLPPEELADRLLEVGWRPPARVVTTVEELNALPDGTVIRDSIEYVAESLHGMWYVTGGGRHSGTELAPPATVLWEPEEGE